MTIYIVTYCDWDEFDIDSIWSDKKLAEQRLQEIKKHIFDSFQEKKLVNDIFAKWAIQKWEVDKKRGRVY